MKNRFGDEYWFEQVEPNVYTVRGELKHWHLGGEDKTHPTWIAPSGGPRIEAGYQIEGKIVTRITVNKYWATPFRQDLEILFTVER